MTCAAQLLTAPGGAANVVPSQPCLTRLRVEAAGPVDDEALRAAGPLGAVRTGRMGVGPTTDVLAAEIDGMR